jgi:lipopolysaccharide/colanic/teichoic acid biosynthesis glycosyltransferase
VAGANGLAESVRASNQPGFRDTEYAYATDAILGKRYYGLCYAQEGDCVKKNRFQMWVLATDLLWVAIAFLCADVLRYGIRWGDAQEGFVHNLLPFLFVAWLLWVLLSNKMNLEGFRGGWHFPAMVSAVFLGVSFLMTVMLAGSYLSRRYVSRLALGYFGILLLVGFLAIRYGARLFLRARHRAGKVGRVVIVGNGQVARELASKIERHPEMLCRVVGFLYPQETSGNLGLPRTGTGECTTLFTLKVVDLLRSRQVDELILALQKPSWPELLNLVGRCRGQGINVSLVPQPYELYLSKPDLLDLGGLPVLRLRESSTSNMFFQWKRIVDLVITTLLSLAAFPVLLGAAIALRWTKGQAFRWETRSGKNGKLFNMLRLNVERHATDIPGFERFLQQLSITELPQLFNVLCGDMSLVGPRPESPERVRHYSEWEQQRLSVKPGITGLAQVHGLREQHSSEEKTRFDLQYLLKPSPLTDLSLLLQTSWTLIIRMFHQRRSSPAEPIVSVNKKIAEFRFPSVEEALQHAHRSQPSAD